MSYMFSGAIGNIDKQRKNFLQVEKEIRELFLPLGHLFKIKNIKEVHAQLHTDYKTKYVERRRIPLNASMYLGPAFEININTGDWDTAIFAVTRDDYLTYIETIQKNKDIVEEIKELIPKDNLIYLGASYCEVLKKCIEGTVPCPVSNPRSLKAYIYGNLVQKCYDSGNRNKINRAVTFSKGRKIRI